MLRIRMAAAPGVEDRFGLVGLDFEGKFHVDAIVAEGGFGAVYSATHLALRVQVALKVLKTPADMNEASQKAFIDKFLDEARTIARIRHPSIVQVMDTGVATTPTGATAPWMVLEWLAGETLEEFFRKRRGAPPTSPREALALLEPVFDALAFAHEQGVAHRDIKPGNVMLSPGRRGQDVRLLDFGIAKVMEPDEQAGGGMTQTNSSMHAYSPKYGSPEQAGHARTGPWTDVHALGLMLTEALTNCEPLRGNSLMEVIAEIMSRDRPTPAKYGYDVGVWEPVIAKAVALTPSKRFANAGEFLEALRASVPEATKQIVGSIGFVSTLVSDTGPGASSGVSVASGPSPITASIDPAREVPKPATSTTLGGSAREIPSPPPRARSIVPGIAIALVAVMAAGLGIRQLMHVGSSSGPNATTTRLVVTPAVPEAAHVAPSVRAAEHAIEAVAVDAARVDDAAAHVVTANQGDADVAPRAHRVHAHRQAETTTPPSHGLGYAIP